VDNSRAGAVLLEDDRGKAMLRGSSLTGLRLGEGGSGVGGLGEGNPATGPSPNSGVRGLAMSMQVQDLSVPGRALTISGALDGTGYALVAVAGAGAGAVTVKFVGCQTGQIVLITVAPTGADVTLPGAAVATGAAKVVKAGTTALMVLWCQNPTSCVLAPVS
jgi:hypothetical protein